MTMMNDKTRASTECSMSGTKSAPKYRVIHVPLGSVKRDTILPHGAQPPRYNPDIDEPIFRTVWQKVAERKRLASEEASRREKGLFPPPPPGGFRLRGGRNRRLADASQPTSGS